MALDFQSVNCLKDFNIRNIVKQKSKEKKDIMLFVHMNNLQNKIRSNYKGIGRNINNFYNNVYLPIHQQLMTIRITDSEINNINQVTQIFNDYYERLKEFSTVNRITSQSKFESTFLEEMSSYLFKDLNELKDGTLGVFNKRIFSGLKINSNGSVDIITKDVDFCIGKEINLTIASQPLISIVLPVVAVEVKTFLDATMFGEVKSSSRAIKNATPKAKPYVLMGYRALADSHIIAARNDSALTEMFVLRENANDPMHAEVLIDYWKEIMNSVHLVSIENPVGKIGRLLKR